MNGCIFMFLSPYCWLPKVKEENNIFSTLRIVLNLKWKYFIIFLKNILVGLNHSFSKSLSMHLDRNTNLKEYERWFLQVLVKESFKWQINV